MQTLKFYKLFPNAEVPQMATLGSACFDLKFQQSENDKSFLAAWNSLNETTALPIQYGEVKIWSGCRVLVPTGLIADIPIGHSIRVHARSSVAIKRGLMLVNSEGIIDSDYVEQIYIPIYNATGGTVTITLGERLAQGELIKDLDYIIAETTEAPKQKTDRNGGLGSTGR